MIYRRLKQALYAGGFFGVLWLIIVLIVVVFVPEPRRAVYTPPSSTYAPVEVESVVIIQHGTDVATGVQTADVVAQLRNPNPRAGVVEYPIKFVLLNPEGAVIKRIQQTTYLLPGAIHYAAVLDVHVPSGQQLTSVRLEEPDNVTFTEIPENVDPPQFSVSLRDRTTKQLGNHIVGEQRGIVTNHSAFDWQSVELVAVGLAGTGDIIAVGKTFVGRLEVLEQREFTVQWREPNQTITRVIALPSTNMFKEANYENIVGDPSLLR